MSYPQGAPTGPVTNAGEAQAYLAWHSPEASAARNKKASEDYAKSPEGMAKAKAKQDKQNTITKIYNEQGDKALADWYLSQDPKTITRAESNPAKLVQAGKTTFAQAAKDEVTNYNVAVTQSAKNTPNVKVGALNNTFQFALDNPYSGGSDKGSSNQQPGGQKQSDGQTDYQPIQKKVVPYNPGKMNFDPDRSKAKDKAQSFMNKNSYDFDSDSYNFNPNK